MARRNAGDGVPYSTIIKHITLYKWRVPCRGQAPGPQVGAAFIWLRRKNKFVCRGRPPDVPPARSAVVLSLPFQGSWREAPERSPIRACGAAGGRGRPPLRYRIFIIINHIALCKWWVPCRGTLLRRIYMDVPEKKFVCRGRPPDVPPARSAVVLSLPFQGSWRGAPERSPIRAFGAAGGRGRPSLRFRIFTFINHITMREAQFTRRKPQFTSEGQFTPAHIAANHAPQAGAAQFFDIESYIDFFRCAGYNNITIKNGGCTHD